MILQIGPFLLCLINCNVFRLNLQTILFLRVINDSHVQNTWIKGEKVFLLLSSINSFDN